MEAKFGGFLLDGEKYSLKWHRMMFSSTSDQGILFPLALREGSFDDFDRLLVCWVSWSTATDGGAENLLHVSSESSSDCTIMRRQRFFDVVKMSLSLSDHWKALSVDVDGWPVNVDGWATWLVEVDGWLTRAGDVDGWLWWPVEAWTGDATGTSSSGSLGTNERLRSGFDVQIDRFIDNIWGRQRKLANSHKNKTNIYNIQ
jgi:hypothetical protein